MTSLDTLAHLPDRHRCVSHVVDLLIRRCYSEIEQLSKGKRLSASELEGAIAEYGGTLVHAPAGSTSVEFIRVELPGPECWRVDVDLYTQEEGRSDLTLQLTLERDRQEPFGYRVEIDDLHVL